MPVKNGFSYDVFDTIATIHDKYFNIEIKFEDMCILDASKDSKASFHFIFNIETSTNNYIKKNFGWKYQ